MGMLKPLLSVAPTAIHKYKEALCNMLLDTEFLPPSPVGLAREVASRPQRTFLTSTDPTWRTTLIIVHGR